MIELPIFAGYGAEFAAMAVAHLIAVMSPGPDFAVVSRYSVRFGARVALWVSLGIGLGILVHVTYSILGLALVIHQTPWLYRLLFLVAAAYFFWLGYHALRSGPPQVNAAAEQNDIQGSEAAGVVSAPRAVAIGFLTNGLNIKATMFFLGLFTSIIAPTTPVSVKAGYGLYLALATFTWFAFLSLLLGRTRIRDILLAHGYWFDRLMGVLLWALASHLLFQWWHIGYN